MKTILLVYCVFSVLARPGFGQQVFYHVDVNPPPTQAQIAAAAAAEQRDALLHKPPTDLRRIVNDKIVWANGAGWWRFWGIVEEHTVNGFLIRGTVANETNDWSGRFFLTNFPGNGADHDFFAFADSWWAKMDGYVTNGRTVYHLLNYEQVWAPGWRTTNAPARWLPIPPTRPPNETVVDPSGDGRSDGRLQADGAV